MDAHAQWQGFETLDVQERVERARRGAEVAQQGDPHLDDVGDGAHRLHRLGPHRAVIGRVGLVQQREALGVLFPVEIAAIDDDAADRGAVAADVFGRRMHDDSGAVVERPAEDRRRRVVHDQRHAHLAADLGDFADREHFELRVRQGLGVVAARLGVGGAPEVLRVRWVDKPHLDPHRPLHRVQEQIPGAAVEVGRADEIVAGLGDVVDAEQRGRLSRTQCQCRDPAFELRDALLQDVAGRAHDPGVDVAELLEPEQVRGVFGVAELVARRLIDRHRDGVRRRIAAVAGMQHDRFGMFALGRH